MENKYQILITRMQTPFIFKKDISTRSQMKSISENNPEEFIKRITPQILECFDNNYTFATPKDWDNNFNLLGGGQSRRTSSAILKRMTWDQFLYNAETIIREHCL